MSTGSGLIILNFTIFSTLLSSPFMNSLGSFGCPPDGVAWYDLRVDSMNLSGLGKFLDMSVLWHTMLAVDGVLEQSWVHWGSGGLWSPSISDWSSPPPLPLMPLILLISLPCSFSSFFSSSIDLLYNF